MENTSTKNHNFVDLIKKSNKLIHKRLMEGDKIKKTIRYHEIIIVEFD